MVGNIETVRGDNEEARKDFWTSETECGLEQFIGHVVACRTVKDLLVMSFD